MDKCLLKKFLAELPKIDGLDKDWNTIKVEVVGNTYTTWLNGTEIMNYESETIVPEGPIGIQVHPKREMTVDFRNILAKELP